MTLVQPTVDMQVEIRKELNEDVKTREQDLEHIKQWLARQPHLPYWDDDGRLMTFLRGCKFSLEKTKKKLDMYFTMRAAVPEFFSQRDPTRPEIQEALKLCQSPTLAKLTPDGRRLTVVKGFTPEAPLPIISEAMKVMTMIGDIRLKEEFTGVAGDVIIMDASIVTPSHFAQNFPKFTPTLVKKFLICVQEAYPIKMKAVHIINVSPVIDTILNFVKPFLKEKIRNRIHIHSDLESLYKHLPKDVLPEEYGGTAGTIVDAQKEWAEKLMAYRQWFIEQETVKADETKRPGKPKTIDDLFGIEGSFKKLTVD